MNLIRLAAAELNQTPLDWRNNKANILAAIAEARRQQATVLCLPELCITGYGCEDAFHSPGTWRSAWQLLQDVLPQTRGLIVSLGLPIYFQHSLFNACCLAVDGRILGFVAKRFLAGDGIHYEPRWFKPWPPGVRVSYEAEGDSYPLGDLFFDCGGVKIGFEICEDAWVANRPGNQLSQWGVDIILNPSASHFAFGKREIRWRFVLEGSRAFGVSYVYSNLLGNEAGRAIYDGCAMIASAGKMLAQGPRFSFADVQVTSAVVDLDLTRMSQARTFSYSPQLEVQPGGRIAAEFRFPDVEPELSDVEIAAWEHSDRLKEEEFARAVPLALFDYLRKSRSRGFVVSISGGADSAAVACLVWLMVKLGVRELGREEFLFKLSYIEELQSARTDEELVARLLTTVYQATAHSGDVTQRAAEGVARAIGASHYHFDIEPIVQQYITTVSKAIGRPLSWDTDDLALQNIQARVRSPGVWMIANIRGALLLSTSNRSEAAVGYATMDGDTSGGVSPIAGIDKAFLRQWLHWLETAGPDGLNLPALRAVNEQQPTAELRPQAACQTDEGDLMPYPLLDAIERLAIRDKKSPAEVLRLIRLSSPECNGPQLVTWVERFFRLWSRNQWKRERYAPSFHVDDENLDPKTWCRFPILSGGFEQELAEMRANNGGPS